MADSILLDIKKVLGIDEAYDAFDTDVLMGINTAISTLTQLGVGPAEGFVVEDKDTAWEDFLGDDKTLSGAKTYIQLRTRLIFDPPATSFTIAAYEKQCEVLEWRLNTHVEFTTPNVVPQEED